jgi:hypothetical protein
VNHEFGLLLFLFLRLRANRLEQVFKKSFEVSLLEALRFLKAAWNSVKEETIRKGFKKAGFEKNNDEICFFPTVFTQIF